MSGSMIMTREMAEKVVLCENVEQAYDQLALYWPFGLSVMKIHAYDWVAGDDAEVFCVVCGAKQLLHEPERESMPMGTMHPIGDELVCECGFVFDLSEDDEMYDAWMNGDWSGDTYDWQPY